jgi:prepilin peptidase CpaA
MSVLDAAVLLLFPALMAYAALSDLFTMTISNVISIVLVVAFVALAAGSGMPMATLFGMHLASGLAVLVLTFVFFARGWIGGGDAKLAAATAVWLGWSNLIDYGVEASLLGAMLTIAILYMRKMALPMQLMDRPWIARLHQKGNGVPYGIALAIAGLWVYPDTALWHAVVGS